MVDKNILDALRGFLVAFVAVSALCFIIYGAVQQTLRQSLDDPQVQMAEEAAAAWAEGGTVPTAMGDKSIDIERSLTPFLIGLNNAGEPFFSTGRLGQRIPVPSAGVLDHARHHSAHILTWEPRPGVRCATVIVPFQGAKTGFAVAGRSMRVVEGRILRIGLLIAAGWGVAVSAQFVLAIGFVVLGRFRGTP